MNKYDSFRHHYNRAEIELIELYKLNEKEYDYHEQVKHNGREKFKINTKKDGRLVYI